MKNIEVTYILKKKYVCPNHLNKIKYKHIKNDKKLLIKKKPFLKIL